MAVLRLSQRNVVGKFASDLGDVGERPLFFNEGGIIVKALRIQQMQATKMARPTELLRSGGQQLQAGYLICQRGDQIVFQTGGLRRPCQMVGLIDHQYVPMGVQHRPRPRGIGEQ